MGSVYEEITRLETAKADIETAIEGCGVNVPDTDLISTYALYIRQIPSAVFSELNADPVGGEDKYIQKIELKDGLINATAGGLVSSTSSGLAPKVINTNTATVGSAYYVLASTNGSASPSWYKLPANAFSNTTYTFTNGTAGNFTVTPSGGTAQTVSIGKPATAGTADVAVKLQTKRKLWGLDFDGSADVSGDMTGVGVINKVFKVTSIQDIAQLNVSEEYSTVNYSHLYVSSNNTSHSNSRPLVLQNGYGNVGIGVIAPTQKLEVNGNVKATTFIGNLDGTYVNKLTGYTKATAIAAIAATDSLNTALGKLEYKADVTYDLVKGAYDGDGTIENLAEILKVLDGIKDTDTIQAIIGKYLPLTGGTLTGSLVVRGASFIKSDTSILRLLSFGSTNYIESGNSDFTDNATLKITGYDGFTGSDLYLLFNHIYCRGGNYTNLDSGNTYINNGTVTINGTSITPVTSRGYIGTTAVQASSAAQALTGITTADFTGNVTLYAASGDSPHLVFKRGSMTDGVYDWDLYVTGGTFKLRCNTSNTESAVWTDVLSMYPNTITTPWAITAKNFIKSGSSDSYVLLGGGGHKALSDFLLETEFASKELSSNLTTITKTLTVTKGWMDTGIKYTDLSATGTYIVQLTVSGSENSTGNMYYCYWSGVMSWYIGGTNDSESDEILLHRSGHAYENTIYLRTIMTGHTDGRHLRLLIAANKDLGAAYTYTFKFKKLI